MENFTPKEINLSNIHGGQRYQNGDIVDAEAINAPIEAAAKLQEDVDGLEVAIDKVKEEDIPKISNRITTLAEEINSDISNINVGIEKLSQKSSKNEKRIENIIKGLPEEVFEYDTSTLFAKSVPLNALPYAAISKIGGQTRKSKNLLNMDYDFDGIIRNGITAVVNNNGTITLNGTATADVDFSFGNPTYFAGVSYFLSGCPSGGGNGKYCLYSKDASDYGLKTSYDYGSGVAITSQNYAEAYVGIKVWKGVTINNKTFKPMVNLGKSKKQYEKSFEGLQSDAVTSIESYDGSNLIIISENSTESFEGISISCSIDGSINIDGRADEPVYFEFATIKLTKGVYQFSGFPEGYEYSEMYIENENNPSEVHWSDEIFTVSSEAVYKIYIEMESEGDTFDDVTFYPKLCVVSSDLPNSTSLIDKIQIPQAVQSIDGYGYGINETCYNYIDWENKNFFKYCEKLVLDGDEPWGINSDGTRFYLYSGIFETSQGEILSNKYSCAIWDALYVDVASTGLNTLDEFKDFLATDNLEILFKKSTPEIIDISDILPYDNLINVKGGGFITFANEHKNDVPSEVVYQTQEVAE